MDKVKYHQIDEDAVAEIRDHPINLLEDVDTATTPPTNGQALVWDDTPGTWVPGTVAAGGSIDTLTDVDTSTTSPTDGQALVWDGTANLWVPGDVGAGGGGGSANPPTVKRLTSPTTIPAAQSTFTVIDATKDITIPASVGDIIAINFNARVTEHTNYGLIDLATMNGSTILNRWLGGGTEGVHSWVLGPSSGDQGHGAVVYWTIASGDLVSGNVTFRLYARSTGSDVSLIDSTFSAQNLSAGSSGGGGSSGVLLLDWAGTVPSGTPVGTLIFRKAPDPYIYDFTQGSLPAGWSKHGTPTETFSGAGMAVTFSAGQGYHINTPVTGDFTVEMKMTALGSQGTMFGPGITDAAGTGVQCSWYNAPAGLLTEAITSYAYASSFTNGGGTFALPNRIRIKRVGTLYTSSYSFDEGATWSAESASLSSSITPARVNIGSAFGGSTITVTEVKVQATSSAAAAGTAKGWWDGSAIQPLG